MAQDIDNVTVYFQDDEGLGHYHPDVEFYAEVHVHKGRDATWDDPAEPGEAEILSIFDHNGHELPTGLMSLFMDQYGDWIEQEAHEKADFEDSRY